MQIDRDLLAERWPVLEWHERTPRVNLPALAQAVRQSALVFGWFASWHTFWPVVLARLWRKPVILVVGGYDVAQQPAIGYGHQRGGLPGWVSQTVLRFATHIVPFSQAAQQETLRVPGVAPARVAYLYLGVPDPFGALPVAPRAALALTVGNVDESTLRRKGLLLFVQTAAHLPTLEFVVAGRWQDRAIETLQAHTAPNVTFTNFLSAEALLNYYRRASVYVQASHHEGFGLAVAEAMLAGCIPVTTAVGSLPEVVGNLGETVTPTPAAIAAGIQAALAHPAAARAAARARILTEFPLEKRRQGLWALVESALATIKLEA